MIPHAKTFSDYQETYNFSIQNPENFWGEEGKRLTWIRPYKQVQNTSFDSENFCIRWYEDGLLNATQNCLDRHLPTLANKTALIWEGDDPSQSRQFTYQDLYTEVCQLANAFKAQGIKKGDRVIIYLPLIPEAVISMLACARIGAIHSVVFGGFSAEALANRIEDCTPRLIITSNIAFRGGKILPFKENVDKALTFTGTSSIQSVFVVERSSYPTPFTQGRDHWYHEVIASQPPECPVTPMGAEDPLFTLYTSGSTGKPKGVLHTTGGYLVYAAMTFDHIFRHQPEDVYWCTADVGWITGHSYVVYGPLANGATTVIYEGIPTYPALDRLWQIIDKYQVTKFYTAPTAIRALIQGGDNALTTTKRASLKILGTVGEPIDPTSWQWYFDKVGHGRCPIVDTWWQTETGGILISPLPGITPLKPGSATLPFYGIQPLIVNQHGQAVAPGDNGNLVIKDSWPGQARTLYKDPQRFIDTYFKQYPGCYSTGDGAVQDGDQYYWITGRVDDVLNVSGHRLGTAEIEAALTSHPDVIESAVVGCPHSLKGQGIYAYVVLAEAVSSDMQENTLIQWVRSHIGPIATLDHVHFTQALPKTRSGKIMRRILRKIAAHETTDLGDTSTLLDPALVEMLIKDVKPLL